MINKIGLDHYCINDVSMVLLIKKCRKYHLSCYLLENRNHKTYFSAKIIDRKKVKSLFPQAKFLYTSGVLGMMLRNIKRKDNLIGYLCMIIIWYVLSSSILHIDVIGESDNIQNKIENYVSSQYYHFKDIDSIKKDLLEAFHDDVSWLEVYEKGSIIKIRYALKQKEKSFIIDDKPLIAKKAGMLTNFRVKEGIKVKKVNDLVTKGEVLVDNKGITSDGKVFKSKVEGQVFAYTWQEVKIEIDDNKLPDAINYFSMMMNARDQIDIDYEWGEKVVDENVLQFTRKQDKIILKILYTLLEDITS